MVERNTFCGTSKTLKVKFIVGKTILSIALTELVLEFIFSSKCTKLCSQMHRVKRNENLSENTYYKHITEKKKKTKRTGPSSKYIYTYYVLVIEFYEPSVYTLYAVEYSMDFYVCRSTTWCGAVQHSEFRSSLLSLLSLLLFSKPTPTIQYVRAG